MSGYAPRPVEFPVVLFRATERDHRLGLSFGDPDNGWRRILGDRLRTHPVAGNHDTMIEGDGAAEIARRLSAYLSGAPEISGTGTGFPRGDTAGARSREAS